MSFTAHIQYWTEIHDYLIANSQTGKPDAPRFGAPYLDGHRLIIPDHPKGGLKSSDAWSWYSIAHEQDSYTLVSSGFDRGNKYSDVPELSSIRFDYVAKYFLFLFVGSYVRAANSIESRLDRPNWQFLDRGVAEGWEAVPAPDSMFFPHTDTCFRHTDDPVGSQYLARSYKTEPTFYLDLPWHEISRLCADGIPGIDHILIPGEPLRE